MPGKSILGVGVDEALNEAGWEAETFVGQGGIFEWERRRHHHDVAGNIYIFPMWRLRELSQITSSNNRDKNLERL